MGQLEDLQRNRLARMQHIQNGFSKQGEIAIAQGQIEKYRLQLSRYK